MTLVQDGSSLSILSLPDSSRLRPLLSRREYRKLALHPFFPSPTIVALRLLSFPLSFRAFLSKQRLRATGFTSEAKTEREKCAARVEGSCAPWVQRTRPESAHGSHNGYARRVNEKSVAITAVCLWALFEKGKATQRNAVSSDQTRHLSAHRQRPPVLRYRSIKLVLGCRQSRWQTDVRVYQADQSRTK